MDVEKGRNVSTAQAILTLSYEDEELFDMDGPQCWQRCDADLEDFLKLMWYEIMEESNCKAVSNWSSCDDESGGQKDGHPSWTTSWDPRWKRA